MTRYMELKLKRDASESCDFRGHILGKWEKDGKWISNKCVKCGKHVNVNLSPLPNEIDISGEAVALHCN